MLRSLRRQFSSYRPGPYSSMMDMGGVPQVKVSVSIDYGKKNKVQAIALDFNLITRAVDEASRATTVSNNATGANTPSLSTKPLGSERIMPNVELIQDIASLLNVHMGEDTLSKKPDENDVTDLADFLSKVPDDDRESSGTSLDSNIDGKIKSKSDKQINAGQKNSFLFDVRSKYASKLEKWGGSISSLDRQKEENSVNRGDAAMHLAARAIASSNQVTSTGPARWLAASGTSKLLAFLTSRSMKIALLPIPQANTTESVNEAMTELTHQLPQVRFHLLVPRAESADVAIKKVQNHMAKEHTILPIHTLVVSDRDDYLREGREKGFYTCRVRPANARRGNVSTHFTTESIADVEDVINELNGLSMNSILTRS